MDAAKRQAIEACGNCGQPEPAHQHKTGTDQGDLLSAALGGPCPGFAVSDAAVIYPEHFAIADHREPPRPGPDRQAAAAVPAVRAPAQRRLRDSAGPATRPDTASRGAANPREALGITRQDDHGEAS